MPDVVKKLLIDTTATGASPSIAPGRPDVASCSDVRGSTLRAVIVEVSGAAGTPTFQIEVSGGSNAEGVPSTWTPAAFRAPGAGAYASTAVGLAGPDTEVYHLDPSDYAPWIRLNVITNPAGSRVRAWTESEV